MQGRGDAASDSAPSPSNALGESVEVRAIVDFGGLLPLYHHIQLGRDGTEFNYVKDGGQDVIFPVGRLSIDLRARRHHLTSCTSRSSSTQRSC